MSSLKRKTIRFTQAVVENLGAVADLEGAASDPARFLIVTNWFEELRQRMGGN